MSVRLIRILQSGLSSVRDAHLSIGPQTDLSGDGALDIVVAEGESHPAR